MIHSYKNILDGAKGLLVETISAIESTGLEYLIVGGWSPYLRNKTNFTHPGTKDVDILFNDGDVKGKISCAIESLLENDFLISAKHDFQLFKIINVQGKDVIYHVDLLHPQETQNNPEIMVDHFDLGLNESYDFAEIKRAKSIALPSSKFLFNGFHANESFKHEMTDGSIKEVSIPLINEAGLIFSKSKSAQIQKRPRDSYDIFLALKQLNVADTVSQLRLSSKKYSAVRESLESLSNYIDNPDNYFEYNIRKYIQDEQETGLREYCKGKMSEILS